LNAEHSWADGPIISHMFEEVLFDDFHSYDENGKIKGTISVTPPAATRLAWDFSNAELVKTIDEAYQDSQKIVDVSC